MATNFASLSFAQFADAIRPSGGINRITLPGTEVDALSYTVYMNGPLAQELPKDARDHTFKDVMVAALTEKLGLDASSFRDCMKIAEIVATRSTWLSAVCEATKNRQVLSQEVLDDYALLADVEHAMDHPWLKAQVELQAEVSRGITAALAAASLALGRPLKDRAPREVGSGKVVASGKDFTVQHTTEGEVVTHDNRYLSSVPEQGDYVTVSYYRGHGQVVDSLEKLKVSEPFIDGKSKDVAVKVEDGQGKAQVVLFGSLAAFAVFTEAHGLDKRFVAKAINAKAAVRKEPAALRTLKGEPYLDHRSGCLAVDFEQGGLAHTVLFTDAIALADHAQEYGFPEQHINSAMGLPLRIEAQTVEVSLRELFASLPKTEFKVSLPQEGQTYVGPVLAKSSLHAAQSTGRNNLTIYDLRELDRVVNVDESLTLKWANGRGVVEVDRPQGQER